ncbi:hypothetical protein SAMN05216357_10777 [Porphyromonadaceae bacterium KH3CP3RA]|nr:hypothetical protein SAMN05216357_10777 [Porphyromonadaceae bacterium KH3CP3RA]
MYCYEKTYSIYLITWFTAALPLTLGAQHHSTANQDSGFNTPASDVLFMPDTYVTIPLEGDTAICWQEGDTISCMYLKDFINYSSYISLSTKEQIAYSKLIRDVKKTLPYAKEIAAIILET